MNLTIPVSPIFDYLTTVNLTRGANWTWYTWHWALTTRTENVTKLTEALLTATYATEAAFGLVVNIILICAIVLGSHTSKQVHIQLINLAIADILSGFMLWVAVMRTEELPMFTYFSGGSSFCTFYVYAYSSFSYICVLWGLAVSIERFIAIYFPLHLRYVTRRKKILSAVVVWITCFLLGIYGATNVSYIQFRYGLIIGRQCYQNPNLPDTLIFNILVSLVPVTITITVYILVACKLCCKRQIGETEQPGQFKQNIQITTMLSADAFFNLISTLFSIAPQVANLQWEQRGKPFPTAVYSVVCTIILFNCFITPVFYYIFNQSIRKDIRSLFKRMCKATCRRQQKSASESLNKDTEQTNVDEEDQSGAPMLASDNSA